MSDKFVVNPLRVRGLGNVVSPKSSSDFRVYDATLSESIESIGGMEYTVFSIIRDIGRLVLTVSRDMVMQGESIVLSASVVDEEDSPVVNEEVFFKNNDNLIGSSLTNPDGVASFEYTFTGEDYGETVFEASIGVMNSKVTVFVEKAPVSSVELSSSENLICRCGSVNSTVLSAIVRNSSGQLVSDANVDFYINNIFKGTSVTNSDGVALFNLNAAGKGDIHCSAIADEISSNIVGVEDYVAYKPDIVSLKNSKSTNDLMSMICGDVADMNRDFVMEWDMSVATTGALIMLAPYEGYNTSTDSFGNYFAVGLYKQGTDYLLRLYYDGGAYNFISNGKSATFYHVKIEKTGDQFKFSVSSPATGFTTPKTTVRTFSWTHSYERFDLLPYLYANSQLIYKNLTIKTLSGGGSEVNPVARIELNTDKTVLSKAHNESTVLTATAYDENDDIVPNAELVFKLGFLPDDYVGDDTFTVTTDNLGRATYTYNSLGVGDTFIGVSAEDGEIYEEIILEDCAVAILEERNFTRQDRNYIAFDTDFEFELPSEFEWSVDMKTTGASMGNEHRIYIVPTEMYNSSMISQSQPNPSVFVGYTDTKVEYGVRITGTSSETKTINDLNDTYHTFKVIQDSTYSTGYVDDSLIISKSFNHLKDYPYFKFLIIMWSGGTISVKNIKIKPKLQLMAFGLRPDEDEIIVDDTVNEEGH